MKSKTLFTEKQLVGARTPPKCTRNLVAFGKLIGWEDFRPVLDKFFTPKATGRPSYDKVLMTKILVLKRMYNLSDDDTEGMLYDRQSFKDFCNLSIDRIPDAKTIWNFQQDLGLVDIEALAK